MSVWTGRDDTATEGPNALRWHQCVKPLTEGAEPGVVLIGFACDEGVRRNGGRVGAKDGPRALRKALANMAWHQKSPFFDAGDVVCNSEDLEAAQEQLAELVQAVMQAGHRLLVLGGGHETAWGTFQGLFRARPQATTAIVNIDAHFDLRLSKRANSGTPFAQIAELCRANGKEFRYLCLGIAKETNTLELFRRSDELNATWVGDRRLCFGADNDYIPDICAISEVTYLSIDLDVLPGCVMPAVSSPAGRGVALDIVEIIAEGIAMSGKLAILDVVEFNPRYDTDGRAARTAAGLIARIAEAWDQQVE
jgi:formiminoglutamase